MRQSTNSCWKDSTTIWSLPYSTMRYCNRIPKYSQKKKEEKPIKNVAKMWWMLFDFTYLSCSLKIRKKGRAKKIKNISPPIILPSTISDLFWKIVKTKQKSLVWTKELIELWAKINSLCCILTEKKVETKLDDNIAFSPSFSLQIKKESFPFSLMIF